MIKRELLESVQIPGSQAVMSLFKQGEQYSIWVDGVPLMTTRKHGSEAALAVLGCQKIQTRPRAKVLVGGLGMGFTLAACLRELGPDARVEVAELVPAVHKWNRELLGAYADFPLDDARVTVTLADVAKILRAGPNRFDAILLDVDNGPSAMTHDKNSWLYWPPGLQTIQNALTPRGVVAFWSAYDDPRFEQRLVQQGFGVQAHPVAAHAKGGSRHFIWVAQKA